jgi:hypothetical protein
MRMASLPYGWPRTNFSAFLRGSVPPIKLCIGNGQALVVES